MSQGLWKKYYVVVEGGKQETILAHYFAVDNSRRKVEFFIDGQKEPIRTFAGDEWVEVFD